MPDAEIKQSESRQEEQIQIPEILPVVPLPDVVTFPYMIVPLVVSVDRAIRAVDQALTQNRLVFLVTQRDQEVGNLGRRTCMRSALLGW
jgi:ATP-dependent Lon protease